MHSDSPYLQEFLLSDSITIFPGIFDGYSARIAEAAGFKTATISGAGVSESRLGWADRGILTFKDNLNACAEIADCCDLKLIADADTGYGNAINVHFTVRAFERVGVHCISIEDQVFPKRCGHMAGKKIIPVGEGKDKIKSAADARRSDNFLIRARTDAANVEGVNAAIDRLSEYIEAGADCVFADALKSYEDMKLVARSVSKPLFVNMGFGLRTRSTSPLISPKDLEAVGVAAVSYPRLLSSAAVFGMRCAIEAFKEDVVKNNCTADRPDLAVNFEELNSLVGIDYLTDLESKFIDSET